MGNMPCITLKNVRLGYKKPGTVLNVLRDINIEFYPGDFVGVVGLNGTGKSTLLKTICGLLTPLGGEISIDGTPISELALVELAKKVAIVLTEKINGFNLTAYDAVASGQMPYTDSFNRLEAKNIEIIEKAIVASGINNHRSKLLNELSDGLFQKTMIAKALAQQTQSVLLDEPSAFLDYASKHELFLLLKHLCHNENKCVLVSCHDLDLLLKYCDNLLVLSEGTVELIKVSEALQNRQFMTIAGGYL